MRGTIMAIAGAAALALGSTAANAAALVVGGATNVVTVPESDNFGNSFNPATLGLFTDIYNLSLSGASLTDGSLISIALDGGHDISFSCKDCSVRLDGTAFTQLSTGALEQFQLNPISIAGGPHTLTITGDILTGPSASYSGTMNFNLPVPEPATWAMMLLGFAGIGLTMRSRRRPVLAQVA